MGSTGLRTNQSNPSRRGTSGSSHRATSTDPTTGVDTASPPCTPSASAGTIRVIMNSARAPGLTSRPADPPAYMVSTATSQVPPSSAATRVTRPASDHRRRTRASRSTAANPHSSTGVCTDFAPAARAPIARSRATSPRRSATPSRSTRAEAATIASAASQPSVVLAECCQ